MKRGDFFGGRVEVPGVPSAPGGVVSVGFEAVGVVVRRLQPMRCPACTGSLVGAEPVGVEGSGAYPGPPLGVLAMRCGGCGHVEYWWDRRWRWRVFRMLQRIVNRE
jgi:uncharacterized protein with PIN domain